MTFSELRIQKMARFDVGRRRPRAGTGGSSRCAETAAECQKNPRLLERGQVHIGGFFETFECLSESFAAVCHPASTGLKNRLQFSLSLARARQPPIWAQRAASQSEWTTHIDPVGDPVWIEVRNPAGAAVQREL
jgi:hypothetical protein